jgi:hypothetical protein
MFGCTKHTPRPLQLGVVESLASFFIRSGLPFITLAHLHIPHTPLPHTVPCVPQLPFSQCLPSASHIRSPKPLPASSNMLQQRAALVPSQHQVPGVPLPPTKHTGSTCSTRFDKLARNPPRVGLHQQLTPSLQGYYHHERPARRLPGYHHHGTPGNRILCRERASEGWSESLHPRPFRAAPGPSHRKWSHPKPSHRKWSRQLTACLQGGFDAPGPGCSPGIRNRDLCPPRNTGRCLTWG